MKNIWLRLDKRTIYAFFIIIIIELFLDFLLPFAWKNISIYKSIHHYRKLILVLFIIVPAILFLERGSLLTLGLKINNWKKLILATLATTILSLFLIYLTSVIFKQFGQVYVDGDRIYFIGNLFPYRGIGPAILYTMLLDQILTVAFPEEIFYRGYFQSRLNFTWKPSVAIIISSLVFALGHIDRPFMFPHVLISGMLFGYAYYYSKSIYPSVIAHCVMNLCGLLIIKHVALS